jgi:hypothetical protein
MWAGLVGVECEGSLSVEKDLGIGGTAGASAAAGCFCCTLDVFEVLELLDALNRPLSRFAFFVSSRFLGLSGLSTTFSGMLSVLVNTFFLASSCFFASFDGEEDRDADDIQDFRRSNERERAGDSDLGESVCLRVSVRLRSGLGSAEGSRDLLEKDKNLDDRRELLDLSWGRISRCSSTDASSESGLEPSEDE